jgi:hypothetical protein
MVTLQSFCGIDAGQSAWAATVAEDDIAIGSVADRCLLSGVIQTSHFKGVRTVFDPERTLALSSDPFDLKPCFDLDHVWSVSRWVLK